MNFFNFASGGGDDGSGADPTGSSPTSKDDAIAGDVSFANQQQRIGIALDVANTASGNFSPPSQLQTNGFAAVTNSIDNREDMANFFSNFGKFGQTKGERTPIHADVNTSDSCLQNQLQSQQQQQQQHFSTYSTNSNPQQPLYQQQTSNGGEAMRPSMVSSSMLIHQPQHLLLEDNHRSMSPMEQQHSIDMLMAKELNQLSLKQRNDINEEIHGVSSLYAVDETPELISQSLEELRFEIKHNVPIHRKMAYERSLQIYNENNNNNNDSNEMQADTPSNSSSSKNSDGYVNDPSFLLMFLRRDLFSVRKAALRLANFMELVYELWGEPALTKKTWASQEYLEATDLEILRTGTFQLLQGRDRAGRRILGNFAEDIRNWTVESRIRLSLYCTMSALEDVETQKKGAVGITMWHNISFDDFQKRGQCHKRISDSIPIRFSALHFCLPHENSSLSSSSSVKRGASTTAAYNPQLLRMLKAMFVISIGAEIRPHLRVHIGSTVECMYALNSFGIYIEQIPVNTTTGKVKTKTHLKWLDLKLQKEIALKENKPFNKIECPMIKDVLFGRGWPIMKHPGNVMLRMIIDSKLEEYQNEKTKRGKTLIAYSVVCMVKQKGSGGRFLKEDSGWWVEVSNDMARQKVSIAFRDARKLKSSQSGSGGGGNSRSNDNGHADSSRPDFAPSTGNLSSNTKRKEGEAIAASSQEAVTHQQDTNSSTSAFLGMDGSTGVKRQRCFEKSSR